MDYGYSPQYPSPAALSIGSPRSLRPREDGPSAMPIYRPAAVHRPVIPDFSEDSSAFDNGGVGQTPSQSSEAQSPAPRSAGLVGGFMSRLRRLPQAMAKHHSRESLYADYMAHAGAQEQARLSQRYGGHTSTVLSDIPENSAETEPVPLPAVYEHYDDGTTAVHHDQGPVVMPIPIPFSNPSTVMDSNPRQSKEGSVDVPLPPADTWAYYMFLIQLFFLHIWSLPWSDPRIVEDYVPSRDGRGWRGEEKPVVSWYGRKRSDVEKTGPSPPPVYVLPPTPQSGSYYSQAFITPGLRPVIPSPYSDATTAIRPARTPMTTTSAGITLPSPGASSHGLGQHSIRYSWYSSSPQQYPANLYGSEFTSPQTTTAGPGTPYYGMR